MCDLALKFPEIADFLEVCRCIPDKPRPFRGQCLIGHGPMWFAAPPLPVGPPLLESSPKQTFPRGGERYWMKDDTRARDDAASRVGSIIPVAADAAEAKLV